MGGKVLVGALVWVGQGLTAGVIHHHLHIGLDRKVASHSGWSPQLHGNGVSFLARILRSVQEGRWTDGIRAASQSAIVGSHGGTKAS